MDPMKIVILTITMVQYSYASNICAGCPLKKDVSDPTLHEYLTNVMSHYTSAPEGTENENTILIKIKNVSSQVVSGIKYIYDFEARGVKTSNLYDCHLVALSHPWEGPDRILEYRCQSLSENRNKRSIVGGEIELDVKQSSHVHELKRFIEQQLNTQQRTKYILEIVKFFKASQQVVAGKLTKATIEVAETDCTVDSPSEKKCTVQPKDHQVCNIEIWEKPWMNFKEMTLKSCNKMPYFCGGCPVEISPEDEQAQQCLKRTLFNLNTKAQSQRQWKLIQITKAKYQVVAGLKYNIEFEAEDQDKSVYMCRTVLVSQPWISNEPLVDDFECTPEKIRKPL